MNYIGIRGHRGAGKNTVAYLLGNTLEYLINNSNNYLKISKNQEICELFQTWCDEIVNDERIIHEISLDNIYFESFGDTLKILVQMILGCSQDILYSDYHKDHVVVNLRDFSYKTYDEIPQDIKLWTAEELYKEMPKNCAPITITRNIFLSLREFILYFGKEVMQRYFGLDVWVKALKTTRELFDNTNDLKSYKIYTDLKTPGEVTYIRKNGGLIIKVSRPDHKKQLKGIDRLSQDNRYDFEVVIGDNLYDIIDQIIDIADKILKTNKFLKEKYIYNEEETCS
jgi:hypothetical protein